MTHCKCRSTEAPTSRPFYIRAPQHPSTLNLTYISDYVRNPDEILPILLAPGKHARHATRVAAGTCLRTLRQCHTRSFSTSSIVPDTRSNSPSRAQQHCVVHPSRECTNKLELAVGSRLQEGASLAQELRWGCPRVSIFAST